MEKYKEKIKFPPHEITTTINGITGHLQKFCKECQKRQKEFNKELLNDYLDGESQDNKAKLG